MIFKFQFSSTNHLDNKLNSKASKNPNINPNAAPIIRVPNSTKNASAVPKFSGPSMGRRPTYSLPLYSYDLYPLLATG